MPGLLAGCTSYFPVNAAMKKVDKEAGYRAGRRWSKQRSNDVLMIVAFSGGGTRAAAFAYGVLEELEATGIEIEGRQVSLLDEVDHITGVSGGSFPAAYYGLHGRGIFDDFEQRFLRRNVQGSLILQLLWPWNWALLFSPYFERSDLVARYYDRILFDRRHLRRSRGAGRTADPDQRDGPRDRCPFLVHPGAVRLSLLEPLELSGLAGGGRFFGGAGADVSAHASQLCRPMRLRAAGVDSRGDRESAHLQPGVREREEPRFVYAFATNGNSSA